ncbi:toll/interleukin-1 receptor domain-containing protein [Flavisphingomonas formosensis]|uniref:toll/interleukin-1 receptor domain-containing protein n=1 Tax=Flavisphingomonas formosensis TaxID=861534 RepID=UPI0012F8F4DD|nr:toll/interleukin-1 receptor domain-containing protein [Sphingomonas formosensis]
MWGSKPVLAVERRYRAFISYSHRDAAIGRQLHARLESYRLPRRLVGWEAKRGAVPARLTPIFRDIDELPASDDLSAEVTAALAASDSLIVLCSPDAAASLWVAREIALFRQLHPDRPILAALVRGEPEEAFPEALRVGGIEPIAADLRRGGDGKRLGVLKLVAGILGIGLDMLIQRDAQRRLRRVTAVTVVALVAVLAMAILTIVAMRARAEAERQRAAAEGLVEFMLTDLRQRLIGVGRLDVMSAVNERAMRFYGAQETLAALPAGSLERRARLLQAMGQDDETRGDLDRALAKFLEAHRTTETLLAQAPDDPARIFAHAQSEYWIGHIDELAGRFTRAMAAYRRYQQLARRLIAIAPANPRYQMEMGYSDSNVGIVLFTGLNRPAEARGWFLKALHWFERANAGVPDARAEMANAHAWIADTYMDERSYDAAREHRLAERALHQALLAADPANTAKRYALVITNRSLARIAMAQRDYPACHGLLDLASADLAALLRIENGNDVWRQQAAWIAMDRASLALAEANRAAARSNLADARTAIAAVRQDAHNPSSDIALINRRISEIASAAR